MPLLGKQVLRRRAHEALERGETSLEGGDRPLREAEICPCSAAPLERSGVLLEGGWAICLVSRRGHQGRGPSRWAVSFVLSVLWVCLHFVFYNRKWVFPGCLGDPYGCP
jgi:hypothetical protein